MAGGVVGKLIGMGAARLGKDPQATYEDVLGGISIPQDKLSRGLITSGVKKGGLMRGCGVATRGGRKTKIL